jgi:MYXO-CTERM domain-containing protein
MPHPAPDGLSGSTASGSGFGSSIFLMLVGLLVLGALGTMRRMRLASEPWWMAPFVLMPERPG